jgi:hypothetical protein
VTCCGGGPFSTKFFAVVHDLTDCAVVALYCGESKTGPAEILAVLPAARRSHLRSEFAFEFVTFAQFLGAVCPTCALQVHDEMAAAIAQASRSATLVLSISSGTWPSDLDHVLSRCIESVAAAVSDWLTEVGATRA